MAGCLRGALAATIIGGGLILAGAVGADTLDEHCKAVDRTRQAECDLVRSTGQEWVLNTSVQVGTGRKADVEALEQQFCLAARRAGVAARVSHRSELPNSLGEGARMEWRCNLPAVSAAPRNR